MDSFQIHGRVIADYRGYIESFIKIRDEEVLAVVQKALSEGRLWPEPLIQFNPSYEITGDLASVVTTEKLHPSLEGHFQGLPPRKRPRPLHPPPRRPKRNPQAPPPTQPQTLRRGRSKRPAQKEGREEGEGGINLRRKSAGTALNNGYYP